MMFWISILIAPFAFIGGFIVGGIWVTTLGKSLKEEMGPPVRWSPEEYEIIKRQTKR